MSLRLRRDRPWLVPPCRPDPLLWLATAVVVLVNLQPFAWPAGWTAVGEELRQGVTLAPRGPLADIVMERAVVFLPFGVWVAWRLCSWTRRGRAAATAGWILGTVALVELAQGLVSARHATGLDLLLAGLLGLIGAGLTDGWHRISRPARKLAGGALLAGNAAALAAIVAAYRGPSLEVWDCGMPLVLGNEYTGDRPWIGELARATLRAGAALARQPQTATSAPPASDLRRLACAGRGCPPGPLTFRGERGVVVHDPEIAALCTQIRAHRAFTLEVVARSLASGQRGPARLVSLSTDPGHRNLTLAEVDGDVVLRVRTVSNGPNGSRVVLATHDQPLADGGPHHVLARYDRGTVELYVDGVQAAPALRLERSLILGRARIVPVAPVLGVLVLISALAAVVFARGRPWPRVRVLLSAAGLPAVALAVGWAWIGRVADWPAMTLVLAAAAVTALLACGPLPFCHTAPRPP